MLPEVVYEKEIVRRAAKELGMDEAKVEYHMTFLKHMINTVMEDEQVHAIQISHLGTMYRNIKACASQNICIGFIKSTEKRVNRFAKNERIMADILEKFKTCENISLHNTRRRIHNAYFTCTKSRKELEEFQNHD
jgi:hypothetical protein